MSIEKVRKYFEKFEISDRIKEFDTSSATVALAAKALGTEEKKIAKTISCDINNSPSVIVAAGDVKIDNRKFKDEFKTKFKMLKKEEVLEKIGFEVGGVCPFAVNKDVKIYLDNSLKRFDTVFPACGSSNSAIELTIDEMQKFTDFVKWVDVTKEI